MYCLTRKALKCNNLVPKVCVFLQKETSYCKKSLAMGPKGAKQYIFGDQFYSKNAKKRIFHVFLPFHARKYMTSSFYLKWTKFTRNYELCCNCDYLGIQTKFKKIHNFF